MRSPPRRGLRHLARSVVGIFILSFVGVWGAGLAAQHVFRPATAQEDPVEADGTESGEGEPAEDPVEGASEEVADPAPRPEEEGAGGEGAAAEETELASIQARSETTIGQRLLSIVGLLVFLLVAWVLSTSRGEVSWTLVAWGIGLQILFGAAILKTGSGEALFHAFNAFFQNVIDWSVAGSSFVFGDLGRRFEEGGNFAFHVLPTIIFFASLMAVLYHIGLMQLVVKGFAWIMQKTMGTSGAETLSAAANIFVGQTEAPLIVEPFVDKMTESELMTVMTGGFATVAGGVMAAYVAMLSGHFPDIAGHLMTASVMSAPAALAVGKIMLPETATPVTMGTIRVPTEKPAVNMIDAACRGAGEGVRLALNVGGMLIAFLALIALLNTGLTWIGGLAIPHAGAALVLLAAATLIAYVRTRNRQFAGEEGPGGPRRTHVVPLVGSLLAVGAAGILQGGLDLPLPFLEEPVGLEIIPGAALLFLVVGVGIAAFYGVTAVVAWRRDREADDGGTRPLTGYQVGLLTLLGCLAAAALPVVFLPWFTGAPDLASAAGVEALTFEVLVGWGLAPVAFVMGVPWGDCAWVGKLIGIKTVANEFVAFLAFQGDISGDVTHSPRAMIIATYALCGFSNFSSIAIQIGGIGGIAPDRKSDLARIGLRAMIAGTIACLMTATVAGMLI